MMSHELKYITMFNFPYLNYPLTVLAFYSNFIIYL